jgi:mRNA interferase MazF
MERLMKGDVVVVPFPFSDLTSTKKRPAVIVANKVRDEILLAQITSKNTSYNYTVKLNQKDFSQHVSFLNSEIKINRLFSCDSKIVLYKLGSLKKEKVVEIENKLIEFIKR